MKTSAAARSASLRDPARESRSPGRATTVPAVSAAAGRATATAASAGGRGDRLGLAGPASATATAAAATRAGALGLLVGHLGHRQVGVVVRHATAGPRALLDAGELGDVGEEIGDLDEVGAGVAAEAR